MDNIMIFDEFWKSRDRLNLINICFQEIMLIEGAFPQNEFYYYLH